MKAFKFLLAICLTLIVGYAAGSSLASVVPDNPSLAFNLGFYGVCGSFVLQSFVRMPIGAAFLTYSPLTTDNKFYTELFYQIIHANNTLARKAVNFIDDVKYNTTLTTVSGVVTPQAYTKSGVPTKVSGDGVTVTDVTIVPVKLDFYDTFNMEDIRSSRFQNDMAKGAINLVSNDFQQAALNIYVPLLSLATEKQFWNGAKAATQTAVAALTAGTTRVEVSTAEKAAVAAAPTNLFDGVVTKLIYNYYTGSGAVGGRAKVAGTTLSSSNIFTEVMKVYEALPNALFFNRYGVKPTIYMPWACQQLIDSYNQNQSYRDKFTVVGDNYSINRAQIEFVPLADNIMVAGLAPEIIWLMDSTADNSAINIAKLPDPDHAFFARATYTEEAALVNQADKILYC